MPENIKHFTQDQWDELCHNNNILKGVRLEDNGPNPSIANLIEPLAMEDIHYALNDVARTEHTTTYTERNANYADHGWTTKALLLTIPWVDGSVNAEKNERLERSKEVKTVYTSVFQRYPFVTVRIKPDALRPTEEFKSAVSNALAQPAHKRRDALDKVFNIYGHALQVEFDLGALMVKTSSTKISTEMTQEKLEEKLGFEFKAIISKIPIPPYVKAGAVSEKGKTVDDSKVEHDADKLQTYELRGGNARLAAGAWLQTISDYTTWRVIKTSDVVPVVELLPHDVQKEIEALTPKEERPTKPLTGKWIDAVEHVTNTKDEIDAKWIKLFRAETGSTGDWFWLGQSLDRNKALIVKENEPGALGLLEKTDKVWDNEGADTREKQTLWDFFPANPEKYVTLGSYFQLTHASNPEPPLSLKTGILKNLRAVRSDLLVKATLGKQVYWDNDTSGIATHKASMWEVVQTEESEKDEAPEALETHLFKAFRGVGTQREQHCERSVWLIKKDAIEIMDEDYKAPAHNHAFVGETRVREAGCLRSFGRSFYKIVKDWFR
ncbi:hypothetical protein PILCRDRAFT_817596 [Piloderma croceum F 1598]|uniref:MACPF-like domain-containing protein n=1 Tax=Piloderma croceum (strain F 1598) TaxID=765440 RepID=A0A0C3FL94_PILCF|nr:hypothetical protein PILCRDRAFT_817596 [Piloderma croceum F 1598]